MRKIQPNQGPPAKQGLYDPAHEHDACGVGFVVNMRGEQSHEIVRSGLEILVNLTHRGACGCDPLTGDGAGILTQIPDGFFREQAARLGVTLPAKGDYGVGTLFLPRDTSERRYCEARMEAIAIEEGQQLVAWRTVPIDNRVLGPTAQDVEPVIKQFFIVRGADTPPDMFEWKLYVIRRRQELEIRNSKLRQKSYNYVPSLSSRVVIYKGLLLAEQVESFYRDLADPTFVSALALVHQRYSTNTFPTWDLAHPFRYLAHNGEINTLRGNVNWMHARESMFDHPVYGPDLKKICPVCVRGASDSAVFDNALELLVLTGRSLPEAMSMLIPEPWSGHESMSDELKAYYEYQACLMEPWDGPASMAFTDGVMMGAQLDRNGLRPSRYWVTKKGWVIMASEAGVLDIPPEEVESKGRLRPGRMFLVDMEEGRIVADAEIKRELAAHQPYREWLKENQLTLADLPAAPDTNGHLEEPLVKLHAHFRLYARGPAHPARADGRRRLRADWLDGQRHAARRAERPTPTALQLFQAVVRASDESAARWHSRGDHHLARHHDRLRGQSARRDARAVPPLATRAAGAHEPRNAHGGPARSSAAQGAHAFDPVRPPRGRRGPTAADARPAHEASQAIADGVTILILSDRDAGPDRVPVPALLATSGVHHHLVREETRTRCGLVVETGEAREVHHFALLTGYGAGAVNPYLAFATLREMRAQGMLPPALTYEKIEKNYIKSVSKGLLKVMSKMGISTQQSYRGAQIFEAIGLHTEFIDEYFTWTPSRLQGVGLETIAEESLRRHEHAYPTTHVPQTLDLDVGGQYQWRRKGERISFRPT